MAIYQDIGSLWPSVSDFSVEEAENMTVEPIATLKIGCQIYNDMFDDAYVP